MTIKHIQIDSKKALLGNKQGNAACRAVSIYLPPNYETHTHERYPTLYLLHGSYANNRLWFGHGYLGQIDIGDIMDNLIKQNKAVPIIIIMPDCSTPHHGSWYSNSTHTGFWEDFVVQECVPRIDAQFRTIAKPAARAIAGHSMGGYGALKLGLLHDSFQIIYAASAIVDFQATFLEKPYRDKVLQAHSDAWSQTSKIRLPWTLSNNMRVPELTLWEQWEKHDPMTIVKKRIIQNENALAVKQLIFDCGNLDPLVRGNQNFSNQLKKLNVSHEFVIYSGGHHDKLSTRLASHLLPKLVKIFRENILSEQKSNAQVQSHPMDSKLKGPRPKN